MSICKDCIHFDACVDFWYSDYDTCATKEESMIKHANSPACECFKSSGDFVEVRHDFNVGDFCLYGFADGNKSLAIVEIVKILDDTRGIAEVKFHKVIKDNTGNGFFQYLFKSGNTMNASFKYLKNITPKADSERREE